MHNTLDHTQTILEDGKKINYEYKCIKCANCCRIPIKIVISIQYIFKWREIGFKDYLQNIQICPTTFSPLKLAEMADDQRKELIDFILEAHFYRGEGRGFLIERPYFKQDWGSRPILSPNSPETVIKGMQLGLKYIIINELTGDCLFLKNNLCSIQEVKPTSCKLFPYDQENKIRMNKRILELCKGLKKRLEV